MRTPFYAESGGQVGDSGTLNSSDSAFRVEDTQKRSGQFFHFVALAGSGFGRERPGHQIGRDGFASGLLIRPGARLPLRLLPSRKAQQPGRSFDHRVV